jgi:hypothetical protein
MFPRKKKRTASVLGDFLYPEALFNFPSFSWLAWIFTIPLSHPLFALALGPYSYTSLIRIVSCAVHMHESCSSNQEQTLKVQRLPSHSLKNLSR